MEEKNNVNFERADQPTEHGGVYSITYFLNAKNLLVAKDQATHLQVHEFDHDNRTIFVKNQTIQ